MATNKKGNLTRPVEYAKHLRKFMKRKFWKGERMQERKEIINQINEEYTSPNKGSRH
jgi:hypothetical protein